MTYLQELSKGFKRLRETNKLTQEQFSEKVSLCVSGVRNINMGNMRLILKR